MEDLGYAIEEYGYYLLSKRDRAINDLKTKIFKKFEDREEKEKLKSIIDEKIEIYIKKGYLNDEEYAKNYISTHKYGQKKMGYLLVQKGIDEKIIAKLLDENSQNEKENIKELWIKMGDKEREKKIMAIIRKGFLYTDIKEVLSEIEK